MKRSYADHPLYILLVSIPVIPGHTSSRPETKSSDRTYAFEFNQSIRNHRLRIDLKHRVTAAANTPTGGHNHSNIHVHLVLRRSRSTRFLTCPSNASRALSLSMTMSACLALVEIGICELTRARAASRVESSRAISRFSCVSSELEVISDVSHRKTDVTYQLTTTTRPTHLASPVSINNGTSMTQKRFPKSQDLATSHSIARRTAGWMIELSTRRFSESPKITEPSLGRSKLPSGRRTSCPKCAAILRSAGVPGSTTSLAILSASMTVTLYSD